MVAAPVAVGQHVDGRELAGHRTHDRADVVEDEPRAQVFLVVVLAVISITESAWEKRIAMSMFAVTPRRPAVICGPSGAPPMLSPSLCCSVTNTARWLRNRR